MTKVTLSRRGFLTSACCLAAAPIFTPVTFAATPGDNRFVTIVLRGAMDGLDLVQPYGEAGFARLRPTLALTPEKGLLDLDGHFGLNPAAAGLMPLWAGLSHMSDEGSEEVIVPASLFDLSADGSLVRM